MTAVPARLRQGLSHWALRGAAIVMAALAVEYATQFGRSVALSHLLGPTEFGIGSAMVIVWVLIDMSTGVGADRYLVQSAEGDAPQALAAAHTVTLIRNALSAGLILAMAAPTASMLGVPQARGSFFCLAAIPLIRGFEHLGLTQQQRRHRFARWAIAAASTNIFGLLIVTAAAFVLRDHRAVLCSLAAQGVGLVVFTHLLAGTPYRLSADRACLSRALHFGLPLMLNGLALAAIGQVDRLAVGSFLGVVQLGRYGLATMLFFLPVSLVARIVTATLTPRLSAAWHRSPRVEFPALFRMVCIGMAALAVLLSTLVALDGNPFVAFIFGPVYKVSDSFFALLAIVVLVKFAKITLNFGGMAMGKTRDVMLSNIPNACGLAVTILGLLWFPRLCTAAIGALVGETLGAIAAFLLLRPYLRTQTETAWLPILALLPMPCLAAAWCCATDPPMAARLMALLLAGLPILAWLAFIPRRVGLQPARS